jgi:1-acyl-sn-glycerol-3-phosphate acyltransferase
MQQFKEPKPNLIVTIACKTILPFWLKLKEQLSIKVCGNQADRDAFSKSHRAIILLNHPDRQDPFVIGQLAIQMHEDFYCIAARECFDWDNGRRGWLFQSLGCYSVARGKADFHSIATTEKILRQGRRKLVVFPEGEITADQDKLQGLQKAIFHIMLDVQKELSAGDSKQSKNPVVIIPAAIKYSLNDDLESAVAPALHNIERRLALNSQKHADVRARINAVVDAYLCRVFDSYGLEKPQASLEKLAELAAVEILRKVASSISLDCDDAITPTERLYAVRNQAAGKTEIDSVALQPRAFHCAGIAKPCIGSDFERIERLFILHRMLLHSSAAIQCCRILDFIESELSGAITPKGRQSCVVSLGTPIDVSSFVAPYTESKEKGVDALREHFKQKLQLMLEL